MICGSCPWRVVVACLLPSLLAAAGTTGNLIGTVTDASGRIVPDAKIEVRHEGTGAVRITQSNELGQFSVPLLPPGSYRVTADAPSYRKAEYNGITVDVDQSVTLDVRLEFGEPTFSVVVTAATSPLETSTSEMGQVVDRQKIAELPLNERNFLTFTLLAPGVQPPADGSQLSYAGAAGAVSVNGAREQANNYQVDGVDNNNAYYNQYSVQLPLEAVDEFKVQAGNSQADFGRSGGAQINVALRSGGNQPHGSLFEFFRNRKLDAKNFFDAPDCRPGSPAGTLCGDIPKYNRNQFGGAFGGPIRKDRTFFFVAYEGLRLRQATTREATVPSQAQINGILGAVPPPARDPTGMNLLALYPKANVGPSLNLSNTYVASPVILDTIDQLSLKIDQNLTPNDTLTGHYLLYNETRFDPYALLVPFSNLPGYGTNSEDRGQNAGITWTHTFGPHATNEARVGFNRRRHGFFQQDSGIDQAKKVGMPTNSPRPVDWGLPGIALAGYDGLGTSIVLPQDGATNTFHYVDNFAWNPALNNRRHQFRFGGEARRIRLNSYLDVYSRGVWNFLGVTGDPILDLVLGIPAYVLASSGDTIEGQRTTSYNFYGLDNIRVSSTLTLNLGLRYEYNSPPVEVQDRFSVPDYSAAALACTPKPDCQFIRVGTKGVPRAGFAPDKNNFAPRVGFSWRTAPNGRLVVRGAYGVFYDMGILNRSVFPRLNPPFFSINVFANNGTNNISNIVQTPLPLPPQVGVIDPHARDAYMQQWNLVLQYEVSPSLVVEAGYVGSEGTHLMRQYNSNQPRPGGLPPDPQFGATRFIASDASSNYHSFQAKAEKRAGRGVAFLLGYTWSKAIDDSSDLFNTATEPSLPQDSFNQKAERGLSNFDAAHRFVGSFLADLPWGSGRRWLAQPGVPRAILGNWQFRATGVLQTGHPFTVNRAADQSHTDTTLGFADRPDLIADPFVAGPVPANPDPACRTTVSQGGMAADVVRDPRSWFNPCAFAAPATARFGTSGRNNLIGPGLANLDVSLLKEIAIRTDARRLQLRFELFNIFNHPNFDSPNRVFDSPTFAAVTSANAYGNKPPRQLQLAVRYVF